MLVTVLCAAGNSKASCIASPESLASPQESLLKQQGKELATEARSTNTA